MLESFKEVFDELVLVRAIGNKQPDNTIELASKWCLENNKRFVFDEYKNQIEASNWDHVDSFANARNMAFKLGTGNWLIWCDCDDILDKNNTFRDDLNSVSDEVLMIRCPYDVQGTGKKLLRERAIKRIAYQNGRVWHHDVHENLLLLPNDKHVNWDNPIWIHAPQIIKRENRKRNLKILGNSVKESATNYFYIHQEHFCNQNKSAAFQFGEIALAFPNLEDSFRYEILLNLAKISDNYRKAMQYCLQAHGVFPWCREAVAAIILLHFERNDIKKSEWWIDTMLSIPEPDEENRPWTHEAKWYGWAGKDLAARVYRLANKNKRASIEQEFYYKHQKPKISLIHATRGRTTKAVACREMWISSAKYPETIEHIFAVDNEDKESIMMSKQFINVISNANNPVAAWNLGAGISRGDLIVQMSDDWIPSLHWDVKLLDEVKDINLDLEPVVIAIDDGNRRDQLLCMAIMSRARFIQQGKLMFNPEYESVYSDNEFSKKAWEDGIVIDARDRILFEHLHPAFNKSEMDDTYRKSNSDERYKKGKEIFERNNVTKPVII